MWLLYVGWYVCVCLTSGIVRLSYAGKPGGAPWHSVWLLYGGWYVCVCLTSGIVRLSCAGKPGGAPWHSVRLLYSWDRHVDGSSTT